MRNDLSEPDTLWGTIVMSRDMLDRCVATSLTNRHSSCFLFWGAGFFDQAGTARTIWGLTPGKWTRRGLAMLL